MTYDVLLSLRGWGPADLESADPSFREAAHFGIYAERLAVLLRQADEALAIDLRQIATSDRGDAVRAKAEAQKQSVLIRSELALED